MRKIFQANFVRKGLSKHCKS